MRREHRLVERMAMGAARRGRPGIGVGMAAKGWIVVSAKHPANRGLVSMMAWVDPALREYARNCAREAGVPVSTWIGEAVRLRVVEASAERLKMRRYRPDGEPV